MDGRASIDADNPIIPTGGELLWGVALLVTVALVATALVLLIRRRDLSTEAKVGWGIAVVAAPIVGSCAYLVAHRIAGSRAGGRSGG